MPIISSQPTASKGKQDARRHREKQYAAIKERLPEIMSNEDIITKRGGKVVRIPIKSLDIPHFRPARNASSGSGAGGAGDEPGGEYLETEIEMEELIELMLKDLGLPLLEEKEIQTLAVQLGWKLSGLTNTGPYVLLDRRATVKEGMRRFFFYMQAVQRETGVDELAAFCALKQMKGIVQDAVKLIRDAQVTETASVVQPFPIFDNADLRYCNLTEDIQQESSAVVIAMMDVSGSMDEVKKYLARSMLYWLVNFLEHFYHHAEVRFIIYHTEAKIVDEYTFFHTQESGGTRAASAYVLADSLIKTEYPKNRWNIYVWQFSDGDDFDTPRAMTEMKKFFPEVNMFGYGETAPDGGYNSIIDDGSTLWRAFKDEFSLSDTIEKDLRMITSDQKPFLGVRIQDRDHLLPALKSFLRKDRWVS